ECHRETQKSKNRRIKEPKRANCSSFGSSVLWFFGSFGLVLPWSSPWPQFAVPYNVEEQLFQRQCWMVDFRLAAVAFDDRSNLLLGFLAEVAGPNLRDLLHRQQLIDTAKFLELALVQDRNPVANVLNVRQQVAAHQDRFALIA